MRKSPALAHALRRARAERASPDLSGSTRLRQALILAGLMVPLVSPEQVEQALQKPPV